MITSKNCFPKIHYADSIWKHRKTTPIAIHIIFFFHMTVVKPTYFPYFSENIKSRRPYLPAYCIFYKQHYFMYKY